MIDFHTYERVKLGDVADFERAKAGKVYQAGCSTIQISATKGQIGFLHHPSTVAAKDAVILPQTGIDPRYFNIVMQKNCDEFMRKYATGLNIQEQELANFPIDVHNLDTQAAVVKVMWAFELKAQEASEELAAMKDLKQTILAQMMI